MALNERDMRLLDLVRVHGGMRIDDLSRELGRTPSTIRRDLRRLSESGRLIRTYGGAVAPDAHLTAPAVRAADQKRRIGAAAASLVRDGQTIAISSGSTTVELARQLVDRRELTVITNSLDIAGVLLDRPGIQLVVLGGVVRQGMHSLLGHLTEQACREVRADTLFLGIGAVSQEHGLMNDYMPEILTDRALRGVADSVVLLADAAKFDAVAPAVVFGLEEVETVVTDDAIAPGIVDALAGRGVRVLVA